MMMNILIIDAQGGGIGKQLIAEIKRRKPDLYITAVGTNSAATAAMLKAGADQAATGENAVAVCCRKADVIIGPIGIVMADAMLGEVTPVIARSVGQAQAEKILIPFQNCGAYITGVARMSTAKMIEEAVDLLFGLDMK